MKLAVLIERNNYFRYLGPLIDAALARGVEVECWHNYAVPRTGPKGYEFPALESLPRFVNGRPATRCYQGARELATLLSGHGPSAVLSLTPSTWHFDGERPDLKSAWFCVPSGPEFWNLSGARGCLGSDLVGVWSPYWLRWALEYFRKSGQTRVGDEIEDAIAARAVSVGAPELDQLRLVDPEEVRRRYGLPAKRPIVLLLQYPWRSNPPTFLARRIYAEPSQALQVVSMLAARRLDAWPYVRRGWNDRHVVRAIRAFCDRNEALLVIKSRLKDPVPQYARAAADLMLYDECPYPVTILELLATSALCIHFFSTVAYEAAFSGVPSICIEPPGLLDSPELDQAFFRKLYNSKEGESFQFRGVTTVLKVPEVIEQLPGRALGEYQLDRKAQAVYVEKFLGYGDGRSADRFLDVVHEFVEKGGRG